jgi:hypothetical protein
MGVRVTFCLIPAMLELSIYFQIFSSAFWVIVTLPFLLPFLSAGGCTHLSLLLR